MDDLLIDNIDEQRHWNLEDSWIDSGKEWNHILGMDHMWEEYIGPMIQPYAKGKALEIACGFGRMTQEVLDRCGGVESLYVVDLNKTCIEKCVQRFGSSVSGYFVNDGKTLKAIPDNYVDFIFSYDSFVHMHFNVVISYIGEIQRVLKPGGICSLHLSSLEDGEDLSFPNPGGRARFNIDQFQQTLNDLDLRIIEKTLIKANHYSSVDDYFIVIEKNNFKNIFEI